MKTYLSTLLAAIVLTIQPTSASAQNFVTPKSGAVPNYGIWPNVRFPRVDIGFVPFCSGMYPGPADPFYIGFCPMIRWRIRKKIAVNFDPAYVHAEFDRTNYWMFGFRPAFQYSLLEGRGKTAASTAYVLAGPDLWIPTTNRNVTPSVFLGARAGLGLFASTGRLGGGAELLGVVRGGFGHQEATLAKDMSAPRVGFEFRLIGMAVSLW
ncbi:MAG TPA: hypothetical protein PKA58_07015 [Polyangium sp.]|jgi:hypothetical protein|nr:hypothetical protein [Polyangium sp.]